MTKINKKELNLTAGRCEKVTIELPKFVMDFVRKTKEKPKEALEYTIVDCVRAEIEGMTSEQWAELFKLKNTFPKPDYIR
jgi:hypothetical protein